MDAKRGGRQPAASGAADGAREEREELYPGIELSLFSLSGRDSFRLCRQTPAQRLVIHYCISGRIGWRLRGSGQLCLGPGEFFLSMMDAWAGAEITLPTGACEGLALSIDLRQLTDHPPEPLAGASITGELLREKFCGEGVGPVLVGDEILQPIFQAFYRAPEETRTAWRRVKVLELLLVLSRMEARREKHVTEHRSQQTEIVRQIHEQLIGSLEQRCSIDALSRQYLMNPTTLKNAFKEMYGTSIAAHIREHRMEYAAQLLQSTCLSVADISRRVGYDSQSRFSTAFKRHFGLLPTEYRKNCMRDPCTGKKTAGE